MIRVTINNGDPDWATAAIVQDPGIRTVDVLGDGMPPIPGPNGKPGTRRWVHLDSFADGSVRLRGYGPAHLGGALEVEVNDLHVEEPDAITAAIRAHLDGGSER